MIDNNKQGAAARVGRGRRAISISARPRPLSRTRTSPNSPCTSLRATLPSLRRANLENSFYRLEGIHPEPEFRGRLHTTAFPTGMTEILIGMQFDADKSYSVAKLHAESLRGPPRRGRQRIFDYVKFFRRIVSLMAVVCAGAGGICL